MTFQQEIIEAIADIREQCGSPVFTWLKDNKQYPCVASVSQFKRDLDEGSFIVDRLIVLTVPRYDENNNPVFPNDVVPEPEHLIRFSGILYRLTSVKGDSIWGNGKESARLRMVGVFDSRGA